MMSSLEVCEHEPAPFLLVFRASLGRLQDNRSYLSNKLMYLHL